MRLPGGSFNDCHLISMRSCGWVLRRVPDEVPQDIVDLMERCMQMDPEVRPDAAECIGVVSKHLRLPQNGSGKFRDAPMRTSSSATSPPPCAGRPLPRLLTPNRQAPAQAPAMQSRPGLGPILARTNLRCGRSRSDADTARRAKSDVGQSVAMAAHTTRMLETEQQGSVETD